MVGGSDVEVGDQGLIGGMIWWGWWLRGWYAARSLWRGGEIFLGVVLEGGGGSFTGGW